MLGESVCETCGKLRYIFKLDAAKALVDAEVQRKLAPLESRSDMFCAGWFSSAFFILFSAWVVCCLPTYSFCLQPPPVSLLAALTQALQVPLPRGLLTMLGNSAVNAQTLVWKWHAWHFTTGLAPNE